MRFNTPRVTRTEQPTASQINVFVWKRCYSVTRQSKNTDYSIKDENVKVPNCIHIYSMQLMNLEKSFRDTFFVSEADEYFLVANENDPASSKEI